jgi:acylphosphatase
VKVRAEAIFRGKVQGVHFRDYARMFSRKRGVFGWVKNLPDGTVEAMFEGEKENIEEVIRLLRQEHPLASVERIDLKWSMCQDQYDRFDIK